MRKKSGPHRHVEEARQLFATFAARHGLIHEEDVQAAVDLLWRFPVQLGLRHPIYLMLQGDELHFGAGAIQAGFFPIYEKADSFACMLDDWIAGRMRVAPMRLGAKLQRFEAGVWRTFYNGVSLPREGRQLEILWNGPPGEAPAQT
jgi:hypothetical protein